MDEREQNPVREEAVVRAHAWCVRLWNERKISAEFTSADEAELVEMMLGLLTLFPAPKPEAYFTLNTDRNLDPETEAALGEVARSVYINHLESTNAALRRQLAECQGKIKCDEIAFGRCAAEIEATHRQLAAAQAWGELQVALASDARAERDALRAQVDELRREREQAQDSANLAWAKAAASPVLIEEYARACHYAGSSGLAMVDWSQWLSRRATRR